MEHSQEVRAAAAWSNIAEPGDAWAGALRAQLGVMEALEWARSPHSSLPAEVHAPGGQSGRGAASGWRAAHKRWEPRFDDLNVERDLTQLEQLGGRLVIPGDEEWPDRLNDLEYRCPPALWATGQARLTAQSEPAVAIVGARAATAYGTRIAAQMAHDLTVAGVVVVSGGAYGIDAAAHRGALDALISDGKTPDRERELPATVAVVCGGLGNLYPSGNAALFERIIAEGGSLIAEVPPRFRPARWRFLERNRLIAGWADVTVVPEAGLRSGALATANRAVELGRDVAAVPGPVTSAASTGPHSLIRDGAALVTSSRDVIELLVGAQADCVSEFASDRARSEGGASSGWVDRQLDDLGPVARRTYEALPAASSTTAERVSRAAGLSAEETAEALLSLHFSSLVSSENGRWARAA